jgi:hypothetical protein
MSEPILIAPAPEPDVTRCEFAVRVRGFQPTPKPEPKKRGKR